MSWYSYPNLVLCGPASVEAMITSEQSKIGTTSPGEQDFSKENIKPYDQDSLALASVQIAMNLSGC